MSRSRQTALETETIYTLLADETHRAVLEALRADEPASPDELGRRLAASDRSLEESTAGWTDRRAITVELIHYYLPKLDDHDVVEYDRSDATVTTGPNVDDIAPLLDGIETVSS
ncbi:hypothetical protein C488_00442 [Natrinema pellirubrum DSM 15624]|uniref:DUF7344 domain-containing protein n=1 Tax=Natrinema pellirubrum (strain DSM 15624 / CIP 106293 / JCM 10476 / NCIMB 786 / 157) TaxID=797303 RepID=L0JKP3_NATP1|nr:hypothetical protein [Natrinema pellirubrum]AGB31403.1 hypothetical protein Natpe_1501 [Natrinema pellirubrum DSM 15624]ELY82045.1 hypothetical protein C488_00442 [Natrinema pellirubrum DSM 15624]